MKRKNLLRLAILFICAAVFTVPVTAQSGISVPYETYEYNAYDESVPAPVGYYLYKTIDSSAINIDVAMNQPNDICFSKNNEIYILDSGNSRIIVLNRDWQLLKTLDFLKDASTGEQYDFTGAQGLAVASDGKIYIADTDHQRILVSDASGSVGTVIYKPKTSILDEDIACNFTKVMLDAQGRLYAIADDVNVGTMVFSQNGDFITFYAGNKVEVTLETIRKYLTRRFMSETQLRASFQYTPVNISNFDIDSDGFIYTVTKEESARQATGGKVRRLNAFGTDTLNSSEEIVFGDLEWDERWDKFTGTMLSDIDIADDGMLYLLDFSKGRVFCYSEEGILLTEFGGHGTQSGLFSNPVAIESDKEYVYVLDNGNSCVYVFKPTDYFNNYRSGILYLQNGDYDSAEKAFRKVIVDNSNSEMAYYGIGKALDANGEYKEAMKYFRLANDNSEYAVSFTEYRKAFVREHFIPLIAGAAVVIALLIFGISRLNRLAVAGEGETYSRMETKWLFPLYTMKHPADGFAQFKNRNIMSYGVTLTILAAWFIISVIDYFCTGFCFNTSRPEDYRIIYTLLQTCVLYALFVVANYAICTLLEGKGTFKALAAGTAYSLLPMLICRVIAILMSNVMSANEGAFINIVIWVGILWSAILLFIALSTIHQYSFGKTFLCILLTIFGMLVILFLIILFYSLLSQLAEFISSVSMEISLR